jgi:hypothetical protein
VASLPFHRLFTWFSSRTKGLPLTKRSGGRVSGHQSVGKVHLFLPPRMALARNIPTHRAEKANLQAAGRTRRGVNEPRFRTVPLFRANWIFILAKGQDSEPELDQITTNKFQVKEIRQSEALTECVASNVAAYATTRLAFQLKLLSGGLISWKLHSCGSLPVLALAVSVEHWQRRFLSTSV